MLDLINNKYYIKLTQVQEGFSGIVLHECFEILLYRSIGCRARCLGRGIKCKLPAKINPSEEHHHSSQYHLPMAFHGWPQVPDWDHDVQEKSKKEQFRTEPYPLVEHCRAWMAVRYKLIKEFGLLDQDSYHSGIYPTSIASIPNDFELL